MGTFVELTPRVERTDPINVVTAAWESDWLCCSVHLGYSRLCFIRSIYGYCNV